MSLHANEPTVGGPSEVTLPAEGFAPVEENGTGDIPRTIGRYVITGRLGSGGMGTVFAGEDPSLGRDVAIKVVRSPPGTVDDSHRARLLAEARALAHLSHPNVVTVYDVGLHGDAVFIAMERLHGETIDAWVRRTRPTWVEILEVLQQAGAGLEAAHAAGLVHRDFKPLNVMITEAPRRVVVLDFGLAIASGPLDPAHGPTEPERSDPHATVRPVGTPGYSSPEQLGGEVVDARTDVFGFCVTAYELLMGELPFAGSGGWEQISAVVEGRMRPVPSDARVPRWVIDVLRRGLRKDPAERFADMATLLAALRPPPRRRWGLAGGALVLLGGVVAAGVWLTRPDPACGRLSALASTTWSNARSSVLARRVKTRLASGPRYERTVVDSVDAQVAQWHETVEALCVGTSRLRPIATEPRECLEQWIAELDAVVRVLESQPELAEYELESLFPVGWCETTGDLERPVTPVSATEVGRRLQRARVAMQNDRIEAGMEVLRALLPELPRGSVAHIRAQMLLAGGLDAQGLRERAVQVLEQAHWDAAAGGMEQLTALTAVTLASLLAKRMQKHEQAATWERHAEAAIARTEITGPLTPKIEYHRAIIDLSMERPESALARAHHAAEDYEALGHSFGAIAARVVEVEALHTLGRSREAQEVARRELARAEVIFGRDHGFAQRLRDLDHTSAGRALRSPRDPDDGTSNPSNAVLR